MASLGLRKILYGAAFTLLLPSLLAVWAKGAEPNVALPPFGKVELGLALCLAGIALMATGMRDLWRYGGGLPMNAFPPPRLAREGTFLWLPHPIYTGFVIVCFGISMTARSRAGLWLITPSVALGCAALVLGYERLDMKRRLGNTLHILPEDEATPPAAMDRVRYFLFAVIPWIALYELTVQIPNPGFPFRFAFEDRLPIWAWTAPIYQSAYVAAAVAPWLARSRRDLRRLIISLWVSMILVFPFYWLVPSNAPRRPFIAEGWISQVLRFERDTYPPVAAFPSFHVLWAIFVARLFRYRWLGAIYATAVGLSCITTGMHYIADVIGALLILPLCLNPRRLWEWLRHAAGRIANSWHEWRLGPIRIINHGMYAGLAALVQIAVVSAAAGPRRLPAVLATGFAGLIGAALWAQWVEGASGLLRPFGFYGGFLAVGVCCLFFDDRWILLGAHCLAAPWMQAIGRLRCLVNGCCHGSPASKEIGIIVTHGRSRVTRLAKLKGLPIHPTQLYSILSNGALGLLLLRMWSSGCPLSMVCGVYAIGNGLARFIEEAYRGEPQTKSFLGLHIYQWIAVASVVAGAVVTTLPSPQAQVLAVVPAGLAYSVAFGVLAGLAMGMDFPESNRRFARLT